MTGERISLLIKGAGPIGYPQRKKELDAHFTKLKSQLQVIKDLILKGKPTKWFKGTVNLE